MHQIINIIVGRLKEKGLDLNKIPACMEEMFNIISLSEVSNCRELNGKMQTLGWPGFEIDDHTFQLIELVYNKCGAAPVRP